MCKYVLIGLIVALVILMVVAAVVVQEYGWTGFLILLAVLVVLAYVSKKLLPRFLGYMITRPLRTMGKALEGARIVVLSISPTEPPPENEWDAIDDEHDLDDDENSDDEGVEEFLKDVSESNDVRQLDWYSVEFNVIPRDAGSCEGRMVNRQGWSPMMISAAARPPRLRSGNPFRDWSPDGDWANMESVQSAEVEIWDSTEYVEPSEQVFGEQRLRMRIGVSRNISEVVVIYVHYTQIGTISIPRINVHPEGQ